MGVVVPNGHLAVVSIVHVVCVFNLNNAFINPAVSDVVEPIEGVTEDGADFWLGPYPRYNDTDGQDTEYGKKNSNDDFLEINSF